MDHAVILSNREQECLLRVIETGVTVRASDAFFLWTQGQLQALLPHQVLVGLEFDGNDGLRRLVCVHSMLLAPVALAALDNRDDGLALRIARHCRAAQRMPAMLDVGVPESSILTPFQEEVRSLGFDNVLVHGSGPADGGDTVFALFGMPEGPAERHAYVFDLVLAHLHLALLRLPPAVTAMTPRAPVETARPLSAREIDVLHWLAEGKTNEEVGCILGISAATVKNHLQRIYRTLGVCNRSHALARCMALRLLERRAA